MEQPATSALIDNILEALGTPTVWLQLCLIIGAAVIAWLLHRLWGKHLASAGEQGTQLRRLTLGTGERLVFPFTMLMLILVFQAIIHQLAYATNLLDIAIPLILSLAAIRLTVYVLRKAFAPSPLLHAWENTIAITVWLVVALHLIGWLPAVLDAMDGVAINIGASRISLLWAIKLVASVGFFLLLSLWLSAALEKRISKSDYLSLGFRVGLIKTGRVILVAVAFLIALTSIGIDLSALAIFGGALGVGLGFGLQRIASNFISGFILLFDRSIRPGDVISIGNSFGWVQELRGRYVVVRGRDGVETLIPNENLITSEVINWSYSDQKVRVKAPVQISYDDDPEKAMAIMLEIGKTISPRILKDPAPVCRLTNFGENGIDIELRVWVSDPQNGLTNVRSDINLAIWRAFKENNITIPYPQRDVHIKTGELS